MSSKDYWARRYKAMEEAVLDKAYANAENLEKQFNTAIHDIDTQMRVWYQRFAKNNDISIADARRMLTTGELKEFKWTVEEYIQKGRESNLSDEWLKELENASARVHISRLDSLKMQLRHKAEELAAVKLKATEDAASLAYTESYYHTAFEFQKKLGYGWTMQALDENALKKVLSKPWTADGKTFTARCWEDKAKLVETVNRELTRMIATGAAPDKAIERIAKIFNTSKTNAGKLVMTESAFFASTAQRDSFSELGVEQYKIVGTLDGYTCDVCGDMDSQVFDMKDFAPGSTAPPFHPWCRCATCPYFADMEGLGERFARDVETGERYKVPGDMTYKQWKAKQDEQYGEGTVDKARKKVYNKSVDMEQFERYKALLGTKAPQDFDTFMLVKQSDKYAGLKIAYADARIQKRIKDGKISTVVLEGKQGKHIIGHNNYKQGRSYLYPDVDVSKLVEKYAGTGEIKRDTSGKWNNKEVIRTSEYIGCDVSIIDGSETPTKSFTIHYSKNGVHIVPYREAIDND